MKSILLETIYCLPEVALEDLALKILVSSLPTELEAENIINSIIHIMNHYLI